MPKPSSGGGVRRGDLVGATGVRGVALGRATIGRNIPGIAISTGGGQRSVIPTSQATVYSGMRPLRITGRARR